MVNMLSVAIFAGLIIGGSIQQSAASSSKNAQNNSGGAKEGKKCWTKWFDRDNPSGSGDWEDLGCLRKEYPRMICKNPLGIQAKTTKGKSVASTGDKILRMNTKKGFVCRNQDQTDGKLCSDYKIRFRCPPSHCKIKVCWTKWFNRDDPGGSGDWEDLASLRKENPGKICRRPSDIQAVSIGKSTGSKKDSILVSNPTKGFVCRNEDQGKRQCRDYKVRFRCPCPKKKP